jgi:mono/diheme cytochrome c family protein
MRNTRESPFRAWVMRWVLVPAVASGLVAGACSSDSGPVLDARAARGKQIARQKTCVSCHTEDGSRSEGPTWKGLAGSEVQLTDGRTVVADDEYLARAITDPRAEIVQGYGPTMAPVAMTDEEVADVIYYIKALR